MSSEFIIQNYEFWIVKSEFIMVTYEFRLMSPPWWLLHDDSSTAMPPPWWLLHDEVISAKWSQANDLGQMISTKWDRRQKLAQTCALLRAQTCDLLRAQTCGVLRALVKKHTFEWCWGPHSSQKWWGVAPKQAACWPHCVRANPTP